MSVSKFQSQPRCPSSFYETQGFSEMALFQISISAEMPILFLLGKECEYDASNPTFQSQPRCPSSFYIAPLRHIRVPLHISISAEMPILFLPQQKLDTLTKQLLSISAEMPILFLREQQRDIGESEQCFQSQPRCPSSFYARKR